MLIKYRIHSREIYEKEERREKREEPIKKKKWKTEQRKERQTEKDIQIRGRTEKLTDTLIFRLIE